MKENIGKGAMQCIASFSLTYFSSIASKFAICMGINMRKEKLNKGWRFMINTGGNMSSMVHGSKAEGEIVDLPHDAMIHEKRVKDTPNAMQTGFYPGGMYEYYQKIYAPKEWEKQKVIIEFEGVYMNSRVYINGDLAGSCFSGYSNFYIDTDSYLNYGAENEIKVTVNNSAAPNSRWYSGSGIYRNVNLLTSERLHIAVDGIKIKTNNADENSAEILVQAILKNEDYLTRKLFMTTEIQDDKGNIVAADKIQITAYGNETIKSRQRLHIDSPNLWKLETPSLYTYKIRLLGEDSIIDEDTGYFGIRTLALDAKQGLRINGVETKLRGTCIHHDNGVVGACAFPQAEERRCMQMKEAGFNCIRSAHNQISKAMLDACDKIGMLVIDELGDMWTRPKNRHDYSQYFMENWEKEVELMVDKDYNHPSVILYCMGNELPEAGTAKGACLNRKISNRINELDETRYTTNAISGLLAASDKIGEIFADIKVSSHSNNKTISSEGSNELNNFMSVVKGPMADALAAHPIMTDRIEEFASSMDIAGFNYMTGRHVMEKEMHPNRVVLGTETYPTDIVKLWRIVKENHHVIGDMTWTGYDYIGEAGIGIFYYDGTQNFSNHWPDRLANVGDIDITGYRRPISYLREIVYGLRKKPFIAVERLNRYGAEASKTPWMFKDNIESWTWPGYEGKPAIVDVYSDADEVELFLNGKSMGRKSTGEKYEFTATYEFEYQPGELKAISYRDSVQAEQYMLQTASEQVEIEAKADKTHLNANGEDLSYITITFKDKEGKENRFIEKEVSISMNGPATIQGFGSAAPQSENGYTKSPPHLRSAENTESPPHLRSAENTESPPHLRSAESDDWTWEAYDGRLLAVIRSGYEKGEAEIIVRSKDCNTQKVIISIE